MADIEATSSEADDDTPFPSGTVDETCAMLNGINDPRAVKKIYFEINLLTKTLYYITKRLFT